MGPQEGQEHDAGSQVGREPIAGAHSERMVGDGHAVRGPHVLPEAHVFRSRKRGRDRGAGGPRPTHHGRVRQRQRAETHPAPAPGTPFRRARLRPVPDGGADIPQARRHQGGQAAGGPGRTAVHLVADTRRPGRVRGAAGHRGRSDSAQRQAGVRRQEGLAQGVREEAQEIGGQAEDPQATFAEQQVQQGLARRRRGRVHQRRQDFAGQSVDGRLGPSAQGLPVRHAGRDRARWRVTLQHDRVVRGHHRFHIRYTH